MVPRRYDEAAYGDGLAMINVRTPAGARQLSRDVRVSRAPKRPAAILLRRRRMALADEVSAMVTAPINKEWLNRAGHRFPGTLRNCSPSFRMRADGG